jgi:hypothetical protein
MSWFKQSRYVGNWAHLSAYTARNNGIVAGSILTTDRVAELDASGEVRAIKEEHVVTRGVFRAIKFPEGVEAIRFEPEGILNHFESNPLPEFEVGDREHLPVDMHIMVRTYDEVPDPAYVSDLVR